MLALLCCSLAAAAAAASAAAASAAAAAAYLSRISTNPMSNTRYYTSIGRHVLLASKVANLSSNSFDQPPIYRLQVF